MDPLWKLGIIEVNRAFARADTTPSEVLQAVLERIDEVNPLVNAFATLDAEGARSAAAASDARWKNGRALGSLDGATMTIKDNIAVGGMSCAWGSELYRNFVPERDELPVARLREAGVIILGKTNVSEFSTGRGIVSTRAFGTTRNPWATDRTSGSSSGGAASAVSSGMGAAALGTDGGGSIRKPCGYCNLVGLKPTTGRVARAYGLPIILADREVVGPIARNVDDLAAVLTSIARPHPLDRDSWSFAEIDAHLADPQITPQRILYVQQFGDHPVDPIVAQTCARVAKNLAALGHRVDEGAAPFDTRLNDDIGPLIAQAGVAWLVRDVAWQGRIGDYYAELVERGSRMTAADYIGALTAQRTIQGQIGEFFERFDLLLTPTVGVLAGPAEQPSSPHENAFGSLANTAGVPAIAIPAGFSPEGLPIGFQLVGRFAADWHLVNMGRQYQAQYSWLDQWRSLR